MTRAEHLAEKFTKSMSLIEIGASYNPIIPKRDGWRTTIVDHADRLTLINKYTELKAQVDNIEEVDVIWQDGNLADTISETLHGTFDGLIASHVGEHIPDLIGFFQSVAKLLKQSGIMVLALPDKRLCFDFFRPLTTTGNLLDSIGMTRHSKGTLYDQTAYGASRGDDIAWHRDGENRSFKLMNSFSLVQLQWNTDQGDGYVDAHKWRFTPASFELLILELNLLRVIPWAISHIEPTDAVEFYVWLEQREIQLSAEIQDRRLQLLQQTISESQVQISQLPISSPKIVTPSGESTISAVIPLYNGAKYIEAALNSVLQQTMPAHEIIVVDDGSTDNGADIVREMAKQHPITLLTKENGGQSSARNFGVWHSTGQYIALLDQDDVWYPHHLQQLIQPFSVPTSGSELGWVYSDLDEMDENGEMVCQSFLATLSVEHPKRNLIDCLKQDMFILPSASLISRKAFDAVKGFDPMLSGYEDDDLFLRLFRAGYNNIFLPTALSKWRIFPESYSYTYRMRRSRAIYLRKLLAAYPNDPQRSRYYQTHLLLPRFYGHAIAEFRNALMAEDQDRIAETRAEMLFIVNQMSAKQRILGQALSKVQSPNAARWAFAARSVVSPVLRKIM